MVSSSLLLRCVTQPQGTCTGRSLPAGATHAACGDHAALRPKHTLLHYASAGYLHEALIVRRGISCCVRVSCSPTSQTLNPQTPTAAPCERRVPARGAHHAQGHPGGAGGAVCGGHATPAGAASRGFRRAHRLPPPGRVRRAAPHPDVARRAVMQSMSVPAGAPSRGLCCAHQLPPPGPMRCMNAGRCTGRQGASLSNRTQAQRAVIMH